MEYKNEGRDVYQNRLSELIKSELCKIKDTGDGIRVEFDSSEDASFSIAASVYGTGMGYCDNGLIFLKPVFDAIHKELPDICFEAECECSDKWICEEYICSYNGEHFETDADWAEVEDC